MIEKSLTPSWISTGDISERMPVSPGMTHPVDKLILLKAPRGGNNPEGRYSTTLKSTNWSETSYSLPSISFSVSIFSIYSSENSPTNGSLWLRISPESMNFYVNSASTHARTFQAKGWSFSFLSKLQAVAIDRQSSIVKAQFYCLGNSISKTVWQFLNTTSHTKIVSCWPKNKQKTQGLKGKMNHNSSTSLQKRGWKEQKRNVEKFGIVIYLFGSNSPVCYEQPISLEF